jgi:hypothetical protein
MTEDVQQKRTPQQDMSKGAFVFNMTYIKSYLNIFELTNTPNAGHNTL